MADNLDVNQPIVLVDPYTGEYKATPWFEDFLYKIIQEFGGEGGSIIGDSAQLISAINVIYRLQAELSTTLKNIVNNNQSLSGLESITSRLNSRLLSVEDSVGFEIVGTSSNYTTGGNEIIICTNTSPITVTLNPSPEGGEMVYIKRQNTGVVTISGNIDGQTSLTPINRYDSPHLVYTSESGEWSII